MNQWDNKTNSPLNMKVKFAITTTRNYTSHNIEIMLQLFQIFKFLPNISRYREIYMTQKQK